MTSVYEFSGLKCLSTSLVEKKLNSESIPIVIDNGSYLCRAGWAGDSQPKTIFKSLLFKQKLKKDNGATVEVDIPLVGPEIENLESVRLQLRSAFDRNVITQYDIQEHIFDYAFQEMGFEEQILSPVVLNEPLCNPNYCRGMMAELLFEGYQIPSVAYGVDCLFNFQDRCKKADCSILIDCGYQSTTIIPVLDGCVDTKNCRRINAGGAHLDTYMQRVLQLKYPIHTSALTLTRAEELVQNHSEIVYNYSNCLSKWNTRAFYEENVRTVQLPVSSSASAIAAAALVGERQAEKVKLVKEKQLLEKLQEKKQIVKELIKIKNEMSRNSLDDKLSELGIESISELQICINNCLQAVGSLKSRLTLKDERGKHSFTPESIQNRIDLLDQQQTLPLPIPSSVDASEYYRVYVDVARHRVPEILFQPAIAGMEQGGVTETLEFVLQKYTEDERQRLVQDVFVTGGCSGIPGFAERLEAELQQMLPSHSTFSVTASDNPSLGAWAGASRWAAMGDNSKYFFTKAMYEEEGGEHFIESDVSNRRLCAQNVSVAQVDPAT